MTENRDEDPTRSVPYNADAEAALLGAAMISTKALAVLVTDTRPEDFYVPAHARLARALTDAFEAGHAVDSTTIAHDLEQRGWISAELDHGTLIELVAHVPNTTSAPRYAEIVHEAATLRRLIEAGERISELGYSTGDAHEAVVAAAARLNDVVANNGARSYSTIEVADVDVVPRIAEVDGLAEAIADRLNRWAVTGISPTADEDHQRETALARAVEAHPQGSPELLVDGYRLRRTSMNLSGPYVKMLLENLDLSWTKPDLASKSEV